MPSPQQRAPRSGPYNKVNAYSHSPSIQQIIAVVSFLVVLVLHQIFITPPIVSVIKHPLLIFMLALHYALLLIIGYDYIYLTVKDPVDSLVTGEARQQQQKRQKLKRCVICNKFVFLKSYHCMRCNRCTENFDHHCKYLNNCVGSKNYQIFFRILVTITVYLLVLIGEAIWVFVAAFSSRDLENYMISKWPVLVVGILAVILILAIDSLLIFHIYLRVFRNMTTLEYIFRQTPSNQSNADDVEPQTSTSMQQSQHNYQGNQINL